MQTTIHIRTAIHSDAAAVCDVLRKSILESCAEDHRGDPEILSSWLGNKNADTVGAWLISPSNCAFVAEEDSEIVGIGLMTCKGKIALLYVSPRSQKRGIGKRLLSALEEQARVWKIPLVEIASTATAHTFFVRQSYSAQGEASSCFGIRTSLLGKRIAAGSHSTHRAAARCKCSAGA